MANCVLSVLNKENDDDDDDDLVRLLQLARTMTHYTVQFNSAIPEQNIKLSSLQ